MKNYSIPVIFLLSISAFGQQTPTRAVELKPIKAESSVEPSKPIGTTDSLEGRTIEYCDYMITAIDSKVAYIKSDQTENEKAIASGWYDRMAKTRAAWVADRDELVRRKTENESK